MANEKIHDYVDQVVGGEIRNNNIFIDTDTEVTAGNWVSKKLLLTDALSEFNTPFGDFYDTTTQIQTGANLVKAMQLNSSVIGNGISVVLDGSSLPTKIKPTKQGYFNIQFSAQISRTTGGSSQQVSIWLRKNGVDVPQSNTHINVVANSNKSVASWNWFLACNANDEIQIMWSVTDVAIQLFAEAPNLVVPHPATPSLIVTISKV